MKRKRKKTLTNLVKKLFILIVLSFIALYIGIKLLVNILFFSAKLLPNSKETPIPTPPSTFKPNISVLYIPEATNSSKIKTTLFSENAEKIEVFLNDKLEETLIPEDNNLEIEISGLKEGDNTIYFRGYANKETTKTKEFIVQVDTKPPKLKITSPKEKNTSEEQIEIKGKTESNVTVKINSSPVIVSPDGSFSTFVFLKEGENKIKITAQDQAGNITEKELTITRSS